MMNQWLFNIDMWTVIGLLTFITGLLVTRLMIWVNIHDTPIYRSSHTKVTPRSGGFGIIVGFFACILYFALHNDLFPPQDWRLWLIGAAAFGLIIVSMLDDIRSVSLRYKLCTQILVASLVVISGLSLNHLSLPRFGIVEMGSFGAILALISVIFFTNTFNFMDGLDGLVSGTTLVASFFGILIGLFFYDPVFVCVNFALFFSTLGFFVYNFSPARIFMGDVGSQFLGFLWALMLLFTTHGKLSIYTIPILFFAFIYDVTLTIIRRLVKGQSIWHPHRTFLFHILHRSGLTHRRISLIYMVFAIIQGLGAVFVQFIDIHRQIFMVIPYAVIMIFYTTWVGRRAYQHIPPPKKSRKK